MFQVNCAVCHGAVGRGDGPLKEALAMARYAIPLADLTGSGPTVAKADGEVYWVITKGFAGAYSLPVERFVMPAFGKLLTPTERWAVVHYLRSLQGQ